MLKHLSGFEEFRELKYYLVCNSDSEVCCKLLRQLDLTTADNNRLPVIAHANFNFLRRIDYREGLSGAQASRVYLMHFGRWNIPSGYEA